MQANELRIGNLLEVDGNFWEVDTIISNPFELYFKENLEYDHSLNANPIPLTEEWLLKFGFEKDGKLFHNQIALYENGIGGFNYNVNFFEHHNLEKIKYVHQLQNLYFALTNEELIIK